jgi:hypothetical protein
MHLPSPPGEPQTLSSFRSKGNLPPIHLSSGGICLSSSSFSAPSFHSALAMQMQDKAALLSLQTVLTTLSPAQALICCLQKAPSISSNVRWRWLLPELLCRAPLLLPLATFTNPFSPDHLALPRPHGHLLLFIGSRCHFLSSQMSGHLA